MNDSNDISDIRDLILSSLNEYQKLCSRDREIFNTKGVSLLDGFNWGYEEENGMMKSDGSIIFKMSDGREFQLTIKPKKQSKTSNGTRMDEDKAVDMMINQHIDMLIEKLEDARVFFHHEIKN